MPVDAVTALHKHDWPGRVEHVLATNRTVAVRRSLDTPVVSTSHLDAGHTFLEIELVRILQHLWEAYFAVEKVLSQTLTNTTQTAVTAVIDGFVRIVVPEFAHATKVVGC